MNHYTYKIEWSPEDNEYVGTCLEFPSLSWLSPNAAKAMSGIEALVSDVVKDLVQSGEPVPLSYAERKYSGQYRLRMAPATHRRLAIRAAEDRISLNRLINSLLVASEEADHI